MNAVWLILMLAALAVLLVVNPAAVLPAMIGASNDALKLTISLVAVYALWLGVMELLDATGLSDKLASLLRPLILRMFPGASEQSTKYICLNLSANILGLGSVATPLGIKAVESMDDLSGTATRGMILFAVINSTSLQLLPTTILGMRAAAESANPASIILPTVIASAAALITGVGLCFLFSSILGKKSSKSK